MTPEMTPEEPLPPEPQKDDALPPPQPVEALPSTQPIEALPPAKPVEALPPTQPVEALPPPATRFPARPVHLPEPTYWPFFMAMGLAFFGWGLISTWLIAVGGLIVFIISLIGWINILRHE
ncbi:MAG TPA: hypothetical protein VG605_17265 [Puia sp.]|nr:hypothetical protein [Puia sp.]